MLLLSREPVILYVWSLYVQLSRVLLRCTPWTPQSHNKLDTVIILYLYFVFL